jgi:5-methylcytosine-specific restriction enzyme A
MWRIFRFDSLATRSKDWPKVRKEHLKIQPSCMACGSNVNPEVHHIIPVHVDPTKELDKTNLITLCDKYCHFIFGHLMNYKSWNPNVKSDCELYLSKVQARPIKN